MIKNLLAILACSLVISLVGHILFSFFFPEDDESWVASYDKDFNFDGSTDVWAVEKEFSYLIHIDRNFDGQSDETWEYDKATDLALDVNFDDNFDGYFETKQVMRYGIPIHLLVDRDKDRLIDMVWSHKSGVLRSVRWLDIFGSGDPSSLYEVDIDVYGIQSQPKLVGSEKRSTFHENSLKVIPVQEMYPAQET